MIFQSGIFSTGKTGMVRSEYPRGLQIFGEMRKLSCYTLQIRRGI